MPNDAIKKLLGDVKTKPNSFEAALGLLCMEWITIAGLDNVIEGLDVFVQALETRRDVELKLTPPAPSAPPAE